MRNTYKYTKMYSGGVPQFVEGDIFCTVIPLNDAATLKSGSKVSDQDSDQDNSIALEREILKFCRKPKSKKEILDHVGYKNRTYLTGKFLKPMIESGKLAYTIPENLDSRKRDICII